MSEPIIKVDQLRVIYNQGKSNEVRSLDGVSVDVFPNEYVIIFGPSGCGKSTLLYGMSGLQGPTYGDVVVNGKNLNLFTKKEKNDFHRTSVGMVFQAFYLIPSLTILDNVCLPMLFKGDDLAARKEQGMKLLRRFGIAEQFDKFPGQLSGGQKQRVAIARALVNEPDIIFADEPVGNLDSESAQNVLDIFKEINEIDKKTVIMVTHNPEHLIYADRIVYMKDGKIVDEKVNTEKRPPEAHTEISVTTKEIPNELKILMRTFKDLSLKQVGILLVPFKAKQLVTHILSEMTEEQITSAESLVKDYIFENIANQELSEKLDLDYDKGGAGWNKKRAEHFSARVVELMVQAKNLGTEGGVAVPNFAHYLVEKFKLEMNEEIFMRFQSFLKIRIDNEIDRFGLQTRLDDPIKKGGIGLYKGTAEKVVSEIEIILLLKYTS